LKTKVRNQESEVLVLIDLALGSSWIYTQHSAFDWASPPWACRRVTPKSLSTQFTVSVRLSAHAEVLSNCTLLYMGVSCT